MAKIRVYELARDLNMKNKALLEKLDDLNISVRSHMSSLEDEDVARIRAAIFGKKEAGVEEMRVKPTVIRRRKKRKMAEEPVVDEPVLEEEIEAEAAETAEPLPESAPEEGPVPETLEPEIETAEPGMAAESPAEVPPAETIAPAVEEAVEELEAQTEPPLEAQTADAAKEQEVVAKETEAVQPETETEIATESLESAAPVETNETADVSDTAAASDSAEAAESTEAQPDVEPVPVIKRIKPKKAKKEAAAKIIRLPVKPKEPEDEKPAVKKKAASPGEAADQSAGLDVDVTAPEETFESDTKKKKGKKRVEEAEQDARGSKKKTAFRRREIVEGADLYASGNKRGRKARKGAKTVVAKGQKTQLTTPKAIKRRIKIDEAIVLSDLAKRMGIKASEMIAKLMGLGVMATVNQTIDFDTAVLVAAEFDYELERASFEEETVIKVETDAPDQLAERPPVVTIMGHVDHGKTSLLDVIRKTRITEIEAGGITQHIGAYHVTTDNGQIVFLDTPGHEAFTAMRARGAQVTDLVVLVVAADDGVMPQTVEAINHSKAAGVPIIVAVNKIDKANADPDRVLRELADLGLVPEDWGGDTIFVKVSAKQNQGIDELLEMILLQSEVLELKANPDKNARGHVIEARLDSGRGPVATVLVLEGTLQTGSPIVCGVHHGKIRAMLNDRGVQVDSAGPSIPVAVLGLTGVPMAGDEMIMLDDEKDARQISMHRLQKQRSKDLAKTSRLSLDKLYEKMQEGEVKDLNIILKADVHGSIEALRDSLVKLSNEEVKINVIHAATGTVTESDISLAAVSDAIIIGFNVRPSAKVQELATEENVDMRFYNIIYNVIQEVKDAIVGMMSSTFEERILGRAEVREVFHVPKVGAIAGCYVTDGKIERGQLIRVIRDGVVTYDGKIGSLRRFKDDVKEVQSGYECGIGIERFNDIKIGDTLECYYMEEIKPELQ